MPQDCTPLTENFPKPLLPVGDKTILDWLVDDIAGLRTPEGDLAVDEFIIISNHKFASHFEDWSRGKNLPITVVDDGTSTNETRLGAVRDIQYAIEKEQIDDDLLVLAGDNVLDFSLASFLDFAGQKGTSCVLCHEEHDLKRQQRTAIITFDESGRITSYEEKPESPKGCHAVPPFYYYRAADAKRIPQALAEGCNADAPGSFAAWLSKVEPMHAYVMPGKRYDIGNLESYRAVQEVFAKG